MLTTSEQADIVSEIAPSDIVVCGFFTPDYRALAAKLAEEIAPFQPFHFVAVSKEDDSWASIVQRKPRIILQAMDTYPKSTTIFLDVDCSVRGQFAAMADVPGDFSASVKIRLTKTLFSSREKTVVHVGARAMVFKQNDRARRFLRDWDDEIRTAEYPQGGCERALRMTLFRSHYLAFTPMDKRFSGREITKATEDDVIVHDSASRGKR